MPPAFLTEPTPPYGTVEQVSPMVGRLVANNPSRFTYHGTGTYLVGRPGGGELAVIDPGPDDRDHVEALLTAIGDRTVSRKAICDVIHARVVELFEIITKELGELLEPEEIASGVLLTGGASQLPGIDRVAEKVLGLPAARASFPDGIDGELAHPGNATVLGLLHYGLKDNGKESESAQADGIFRKLAHLVGIN